MTKPERLLWWALRRKQTGFHFRRQHPAGPYVLDFYCDTARLCVEADGVSHVSDLRAARPCGFTFPRESAVVSRIRCTTYRCGGSAGVEPASRFTPIFAGHPMGARIIA